MFAPFFSLSSLYTTNSITSPSSSSFSSNAYKHTHTQTHPHKQINTEIHKYTHTQTNPHRQTNKGTDRCLIGTIGACRSELGRSRSDLISAYGLELGRSRSDLIDTCGSELGRSVLMDRCLIESCMIGAVDRCL